LLARPGILLGLRIAEFFPIHLAIHESEYEDDDLQFEIYEEALGGYRLSRQTTGSEALATVSHDPPNVLILGHVLADGELGLEFLPEFKELLPHVPIIVVSGVLEVGQQMAVLQGPRRAHAAPAGRGGFDFR